MSLYLKLDSRLSSLELPVELERVGELDELRVGVVLGVGGLALDFPLDAQVADDLGQDDVEPGVLVELERPLEVQHLVERVVDLEAVLVGEGRLEHVEQLHLVLELDLRVPDLLLTGRESNPVPTRSCG